MRCTDYAGRREKREKKNQQLSNLTGMMCFCRALMFPTEKQARKMGTCDQRLVGRALWKRFAHFCDWADRRRGLEVDSSVMRDRGAGLSANSAPVFLTARSAFYSLRSTHTHSWTADTSAEWWASSLSSLLCVCVCVCVCRPVNSLVVLSVRTCWIRMNQCFLY